MSLPPAGRGRGRGVRLVQTLQKYQTPSGPGQEEEAAGGQVSEEQSRTPSPARTPSPGRSLSPPGRGRGKIRQFILQKPGGAGDDRSRTPSPTGGAVGGSPQTSPRAVAPDISQLRISPRGESRPEKPERLVDKIKGSEGRTFDAAVNYVRLSKKPNMDIYEYHVRFEPDVDSRNIRFKIMKSPSVQAIIGTTMQFTGINLFLPRLLDQDTVAVESQMPDGSPVKVTIQFIKVAPLDELIPFYNTLFRRIMSILKMVQINRHYYYPEARIEIPQHKLEVWPGFVTAIQEFDGGLLLTCDASHRVLRTNTAKDVMMDVLQKDAARFRQSVTNMLVGCIVLTRYNNRPYRIDDIAFDATPLSTFTLKDGTTTTYVDYFQKNWEIEIKDKKQPLLINRPKPRKGQEETELPMICLIPELSCMTGLTDDIRSDFRAMKDIAAHTRIKPAIRHAKLQEFIASVNNNAETRKVLDDWYMALDPSPVTLGGRQIAPEVLAFGGGKTVTVGPTADWSRDACNSNLFSGIHIEKWIMVFTRKDGTRADEFIRCLREVTRNMGFSFGEPQRLDINDDLPATYCARIKGALTAHKDTQLVVIMTPGSSQREDRYNAIKRLCCCDIPVPSQVVRANTVSDKKMRSVCQKIALQISCKVGGELWAVKIPFNSCMIVGMDVYHDGAQRGKSVVAVVASVNQTATRWYTKVFFQNTNEEIVNTLQTAMVSCLKKYHEVNHAVPARIFVYRDGVGDGQLNAVKNFEIPQMEEAIEDHVRYYQNVKPTVSVVIVQKKINTKILLKAGNDFNNPPPGSIVDHTITRPFHYDFYLVSQHVTQGTVTPTHYVTLYDNNKMTPDRMQRLTYKMTHMYYNWPGTIRVPAPCQYAHKVAYLIGQNVKKIPDESLCDKLFYL